MNWLASRRPDLFKMVASMELPGKNDSRLVAPARQRLKAVLRRMFDRNEFLSDYGIRSVSAYHAITRTFCSRRAAVHRQVFAGRIG
jgi:hypothetical protein